MDGKRLVQSEFLIFKTFKQIFRIAVKNIRVEISVNTLRVLNIEYMFVLRVCLLSCRRHDKLSFLQKKLKHSLYVICSNPSPSLSNAYVYLSQNIIQYIILVNKLC